MAGTFRYAAPAAGDPSAPPWRAPLAGFIEQLRAYYAGLQPGQRRIFEAAVLLTVGMMVAVGVWSAGDGYQELYTSADPVEVQQQRVAAQFAAPAGAGHGRACV